MRAAVVGMVLLCGIAQGAESKSVTNSIGMELIEIPAGKFTMDSPAGEKDRYTDEEPVAVTLTKPFGLGKTEVTQGQWQQVMGTEPWKGQQLVQADKDCPATTSRASVWPAVSRYRKSNNSQTAAPCFRTESQDGTETARSSRVITFLPNKIEDIYKRKVGLLGLEPVVKSSGNKAGDNQSGTESGTVSASSTELDALIESWGLLTADDRRRIIAIVNGRLA